MSDDSNDTNTEEDGESECVGLGELVCVEYPGVVRDSQAMVETLGGLANIAQVLEEPNRRLELRFRPDDVFCKPTCGEKVNQSSFLLRVKRKRLKAGREGSGKPATVLHSSIVGAVTDCYKFSNLCDFQYLAMAKREEGAAHSSIYSQVYSDRRLVSTSWLDKDAPLFLPPAAFSRMDLPQEYQYRREASSGGSSSTTLLTPHNIIGRTRHRRSHHAIFVTYDVAKVPTKPREVALNQIKLKFIDSERLGLVREKFSERPVWSKNALTALTSIPADRLKLILPALAYYFTNGPWRNQWIRFGYDPRVTPSARLHQTLDYRVRLAGGARNRVAAKRSYANYLLPYKAMNWSKPRTSLINKETFIGSGGGDGNAKLGVDPAGVAQSQEEAERQKDVYLFRCGRVPPYRQMFYQYGDILLAEVQDLLSGLPVSRQCEEKAGWYPTGTEDRLREILTQSINRELARPSPSPGPQSHDQSIEPEDGEQDEELEDDQEEDEEEEEDMEE